jgi:hypothetical protein
MRRKLGAFDDPELKSWLLELIADPSPSFLGALAESVLTATPEDYAVVRPCLMRLREKYRRLPKKSRIPKEKHVQHDIPTVVPDQGRARLRSGPADLTD